MRRNLFVLAIVVVMLQPVRFQHSWILVHSQSVQRAKKVKILSRNHKKRKKVKKSRRKGMNWPTQLSNRQVQRVIHTALYLTKMPISWQGPLIWLAFRESTDRPFVTAWEGVGNEYAIGLMQVLPSTFRANALPTYKDIWNPVDNAIAAVRYIASRYKNPWQIPDIFTTSYQGY